MIIKELFSNLAILISTLFLYTSLTSSSPLHRPSLWMRKVSAGMLAGILSNVLMLYSMHFDETIVDLRHIPLILVAYYGGSLPAVIAMVLITLGRFSIGLNSSSLLALVLIVFITVTTLLITKWRIHKQWKVFFILTASNIIFTVLICYLLPTNNTLFVLLPSFWTISYIAGFVSFFVVEYVRRNQKLLDRFKAEASTDGLTGLHNVRKFDQAFNEASSQAKQNKEMLSLLFIDIDHFKNVNDTYGHKEGDQVLIQLSDILRNTVRSFDIVSRNGGEEFTVILLDCSTERGVQISERIREKVEAHAFLLSSGDFIRVTVSIGLACYHETTKTPPVLLKDADDALYEAKKTGRNKVCVAQ
ncbi:GGDEF domain-containing protein [Halobacillus salinus]|uniref:GGDEF domain-containing protein n=1 Tax=Halobacillus salinus TaxID=192814 RepID=UPI0009A68A21|nr:diguanylate cyclase [Halobacillus salinus]